MRTFLPLNIKEHLRVDVKGCNRVSLTNGYSSFWNKFASITKILPCIGFRLFIRYRSLGNLHASYLIRKKPNGDET